jgi:hypothetical protein
MSHGQASIGADQSEGNWPLHPERHGAQRPLQNLEQRSGGVPGFQNFHDAVYDFAEAYWAVEDGCGGRKRHGFDARGDQHSGDASYERLDGAIVGKFDAGLEDNYGGHLTFGEGAAGVFCGIHSQGINSTFAKFSAQSCTQSPIAGDDEHYRHLTVKL